MIQHADIMRLTVVENPEDGSYHVAYAKLTNQMEMKNHFEKLFGLSNVHPSFVYLLGSAVTLYQQLEHCSTIFQMMERRALDGGNEAVARYMTNEIAAIKLAQRIATEGASNVIPEKK